MIAVYEIGLPAAHCLMVSDPEAACEARMVQRHLKGIPARLSLLFPTRALIRNDAGVSKRTRGFSFALVPFSHRPLSLAPPLYWGHSFQSWPAEARKSMGSIVYT